MHTKEKGFSSGMVLVGALIVVLLGGALYTISPKGNTNDAMMVEEAGAVMKESDSDESMMKGTAMDTKMTEAIESDDEGKMMKSPYKGAILAGSASPLIDFNKADYDKAIASGVPVFLYFYANWCPTCKAEQPVLMGAFNALSQEGVVGFRVNYKDNQTDKDEEALARQYGVAYQHTKVVIVGGDAIALKSPESWDANRYARELSALMQ